MSTDTGSERGRIIVGVDGSPSSVQALRWAVEQGYVSLTPLRLDLTNEKELAAALQRYPLNDASA